jgi:hypothetical protein
VCGDAPEYEDQPRSVSYRRNMRRFQMMYMIPSRRALAKLLQFVSVAKRKSNRLWTVARSRALPAFMAQSHARPSLCSLVPPTLQARPTPRLPPP